jgi:hypothetical protein
LVSIRRTATYALHSGQLLPVGGTGSPSKLVAQQPPSAQPATTTPATTSPPPPAPPVAKPSTTSAGADGPPRAAATGPRSDVIIAWSRHSRTTSWARRARLKGIVDTGATLHLLKDESTPELIDSVESNRPVTGFSGNMSQRVAREGYQHMHFYDPQNAKKRGVTLKLPVSTMKNIEDNIFSASKLVKSMRFKCNLRPDPLEGQEPCPDDWEGFFKVQGGVLYRIPIHFDV